MLTVQYGFETNVKRSGHASCWCPPLEALVQFGGWPPSEQLSRVVHEEGSSCPLYVMPLRRLNAAIAKAERRRSRRRWEECVRPTRACRLARLAAVLQADQQEDTSSPDSTRHEKPIVTAPHDVRTCALCSREVNKSSTSSGTHARNKASLGKTAATDTLTTTTAPCSSADGTRQGARTAVDSPNDNNNNNNNDDADSDDEDDESHASSDRQFVYAAGYHSEVETSSSSSRDASFSSSVSFSSEGGDDSPPSRMPSPAPVHSAGAAASLTGNHLLRRDNSGTALSTDRSDASYAPPALTRALLQRLDQDDTENIALRARLEEEVRRTIAEDGDDADGGRGGHRNPSPDGRSDTSRRFGAAASSSTRTNTHRSTRTAFWLHDKPHREVPPILQDTEEIPGKQTVVPLRWRILRPNVAPRTRHGHSLIYCANQLFLLGGSYWAHGNALASTDLTFDVRRRAWSQTNSLLPPRFCAAVAISNARPPPPPPAPSSQPGSPSASEQPAAAPPLSDTQWRVDPDAVVVYAFGGLNYSRTLTNTLHRLWLPDGTLEELPQYGAQPRNQFKGILICDVQQERSPAERRAGLSAAGRLFYMDGFQEGRPMAPALRSYNLGNGVWTRLCPSPDLTRSQLSLAQYDAPRTHYPTRGLQEETPSTRPQPSRLTRFEVLGGMPTRRGRQLRSRIIYSFDPAWQCYDVEHALPVPGLTAHTVTLLPVPPLPSRTAVVRKGNMAVRSQPHAPKLTAHRSLFHALLPHLGAQVDKSDRMDGAGDVNAHSAHAADSSSFPAGEAPTVSPLQELVCTRGVLAVCMGGNEDQKSGEQNNLGEPVGWLYCLGRRDVSLAENTRTSLDKQRVPYRTLLIQQEEKDELLDELF